MSTENRRRYQRLSGESIQASAKCRGILSLTAKFKPIKIIDFSQFGLGFSHEKKFSIGQELLFNLNRKQIQLTKIIGFVCHTEETDEGYQHGVQFDFSANTHMQSIEVEETLAKLEQQLQGSAGHKKGLITPQTGTDAPNSMPII